MSLAELQTCYVKNHFIELTKHAFYKITIQKLENTERDGCIYYIHIYVIHNLTPISTTVS